MVVVLLTELGRGCPARAGMHPAFLTERTAPRARGCTRTPVDADVPCDAVAATAWTDFCAAVPLLATTAPSPPLPGKLLVPGSRLASAVQGTPFVS